MTLSMAALAYMTFYAFILGLFFGLFYDIIRIVRIMCGVRIGNITKGAEHLYSLKYPLIGTITRKEGKIKKGFGFSVIFFTDIFFCISTALMFCVFTYYTNNGTFRFAAFAAVCGGFYLEHITAGRIIMSFSEIIDAALKIFIKISIFTIAIPFKIVYNILVIVYRNTVGLLISTINCKIQQFITYRRFEYLIISIGKDFAKIP